MPALASPSPAAPRLLLLAGLLAAALLWLAWAPLTARLLHRPAVEAVLGAIRADPALRAAVAAQNRELAGRTPAEDEAADAAWILARSRGDGGPAAALMARPASERLRAVLADGGGRVRHAILMDDRGRAVAIAAPTSDYLQGDEPKWRETFGRPPGTRHVGALERGHDGPHPVCWVSEPLHDPDGRHLGAISVEVDARATGGALCPVGP